MSVELPLARAREEGDERQRFEAGRVVAAHTVADSELKHGLARLLLGFHHVHLRLEVGRREHASIAQLLELLLLLNRVEREALGVRKVA